MYGTNTNYLPWENTWPVAGLRIVHWTRGYTIELWNDGPSSNLSQDVDDFVKKTATVLELRRATSARSRIEADRRLRRFGTPPLSEALFSKPTFVRRACGGRWRVLSP